MAKVLIGLGANLGDRQRTLRDALAHLECAADVHGVTVSGFYETVPAGGPAGQGNFLNAAACLQTTRTPEALLELLQSIERQLGRRSGVRWGERIVDLDLLLYDQMVQETLELVLPHPRMAFRRFVLDPAAEVAADMIHPPTGWTVARLRQHICSPPDYVALAGPAGAGKTAAARRIVERLNADLQIEASLVETPVWLERRTPTRPDPGGQAMETELEFVRLRRQALDAATGAGGWTVSDFWFDQSLAYARLQLDAASWEAFHADWSAASAGLMVPKLLVVVAPPDERPQRRSPMLEPAGERSQRCPSSDSLQQALTDLIRKLGRGPTLFLTSADTARIVEEVTAAVVAMHFAPSCL